MKNLIKKSLNVGESKAILLVLLALNLLLSLYVAFFKRDAVWLETLKAGGRENFNLVQDLYNNDTYKAQQTQTLNQVLTSMQGNGQGNTDTTAGNNQQAAEAEDTTTATQTLDKTKIEEILKGTYVKGKKNTKLVIIEYSDLLCPFCQRHYNSQTVEKVVEKYPNDVSMVFKNMPLVQLHPTAFKGAEGLACAGKIGGADKFYAYMAEAFQVQEFNDTNVVDIAKKIGLNEAKFTSCVQNGDTQAEINASIQEGNTVFGVNGTPGNVILDTETGKYVVIAGAYPFEKFDEEVIKLLK